MMMMTTPLKVIPLLDWKMPPSPISVRCSPPLFLLPTIKFIFNSISRPTSVVLYRRRASKANPTTENDDDDDGDDPFALDEEKRVELRREIRRVLDTNPQVDQEFDPTQRKLKMEQLLADYPLVVDEDDPDWPDDADGWGFNLGQFFNKVTIKNNNPKNNDDDDEQDELVWQDDDYIQPIKDITTSEWEEAVFKDISPLVVFVHHRYNRPKENKKLRSELEKAIHIIWNCRLPSPRTVAVDAVKEIDLVSALQVSVFPELIFTKAGKILHREKEILTADQLSKIMAFFYYGAAKPPCLNASENTEDAIPAVSVSSQDC